MQPLSHAGKRWLEPSLDLRALTEPQEIVSRIAGLRGMSTSDALTPPWTFPDMEKAIERVQRAIDAKERIGLFGDYDCDGVTGTALVLRLLRRRNVRPLVRLPHRSKDGYGLKRPHVEEMLKQGVTLLLTVDTGIGCREEVALAQEHGCDVIILDHHHVPASCAVAYAVLHPSLVADWPGAAPAAAGVAWSFVEAFEKASGSSRWQGYEEDLALGALGTIADLVPLQHGNRVLVQRGLQAWANLPAGPLAMLLEQSGLSANPTARDLAFRIAPRINAAGRMADPMIALKAVLGDLTALKDLDQLNSNRQVTVLDHWEEALLTMKTDDLFLFLMHEDYTPGIVGLLAGKMTEMFGKPSLVASVQGERCTASLRSIPGYNVTEALGRSAHLLETFGGHAQAAGCTFQRKNADALKDALCADVAARIPVSDLVPLLAIDAMLLPEQLTMELAYALKDLEPHGQGNAEPRFLLQGTTLNDLRTVGQDKTHLQGLAGSARFIGFRFGSLLDQLTNGPADIVGRLDINEWQGRKTVQLVLEDLRFAKKGDGRIAKGEGEVAAQTSKTMGNGN